MKTILKNNSILSRHYTNYLKMLEKINKLVSANLTDFEISQLYNKKYNLTEFEIYLYITALDYITQSLGCNKYTLTEGFTSDNYKFKNILIDLYYKNIPSEILDSYPISTLFENTETNWEENIELWENGEDLYKFYDLNQNVYPDYTGNTYTYYVFKQLIKLFLTEVYLYTYKGSILTYKELEGEYLASLNDGKIEYLGDLNKDWYRKTKISYFNDTLKIGYIRYENKDPISETIPMSQ